MPRTRLDYWPLDLPTQGTGCFTRHPLPLWDSGCRTKLSGLRLLTDLDATPVNRTPAYVEKQWMLGVYMVYPVAGVAPDTSVIITCRAIKWAQIPAVKEPTSLLQQDGKRPDGTILLLWA